MNEPNTQTPSGNEPPASTPPPGTGNEPGANEPPATEPGAKPPTPGTEPGGNNKPPAGDPPPGDPPPGDPPPAADDVNPDTGKPYTAEEWKEKFSNSSSEANRMVELFKTLNIDPKTGKPVGDGQQTTTPKYSNITDELNSTEITDDDLIATIPGFNNMSEAEKTVVRNIKQWAPTLTKLVNTVAEMQDGLKYTSEFKSLVGKEAYKLIADHADEFKEFAYNEDNTGIKSLETVAKIFLADKGLAPVGTPKPKPKEPVSGVEPGGGTLDKKGAQVNKTTYTAAEAADLRKKDQKLYQQLVRDDKLNIVD